MSKFRRIGLVAAAVLFATPGLASAQNVDTTDQAGLQSLGPVLLRERGTWAADELSSRIGQGVAPTVFVEQGVDPDTARALAGAGQTSGLSAGEQSTGLSAAGGRGLLGVWVSGGWTTLDDDLASTAYDGSAYNTMVGADYRFNDRFLAGVAVGYESSDIDTVFNTGNLDSDGFTIASYAGYVLNRYFTVDVSGGYSWIDYDMRRTSPATGSTITGETDADRWFFSGNLNAYYAIERLMLSGRVGYLFAQEDQDAYLESDTTSNPARELDLGQFRAGGEVGYDLGKVQPYVTGTYVIEPTREKVAVALGQAQPDNDRSGFDVGGGIRFALSDRVTGGIEGTTHLGRENFDSTSVSGNLRIRF